MKRFEAEPGLGGAWDAAKNLPDEIRLVESYLEKLSNALNQSGYDANYFDELLQAKLDPQNFIDDFVAIIGDNGIFIDNAHELNYQAYLGRKAKQGKRPRDRSDWKQASDYIKFDSPIARGNKFNTKAWDEQWYPFWEVYLDNGKYIDGLDFIKKEIVSRKATDLIDISEDTYVKYLAELALKYSPPKIIKSKKPGYDVIFNKSLPTDSKLILEIPDSNLSFFDLKRYKEMALEKGIELRFRPE